MNRREILKTGGAVGAAALTGVHRSWASERATKPHRVAVIGTGWYGKNDLFKLMQVAPCEVVGLCDVDSLLVKEAAAMIPGREDSQYKQNVAPNTYKDYRDLLKAEEPEIVIVGTPDHWHALPTIDALKAGAHVYVQKPVSVDVAEGEAMVAAARRYDRKVQVGLQRRSTRHMYEARDKFLRSGRIGKVGLVEVFSDLHQRPAHYPVSKPPATVDWDMWVGPAPFVPYSELLHVHRAWRGRREFSNGPLGDVGVHYIDTARWLLGLDMPTRISCTGGVYTDKKSNATVPDTQNATWDFGDVMMVWSNRTYGPSRNPRFMWGAIIHGTGGSLELSNDHYAFIPADGSEWETGEPYYERERYPLDAEIKPWPELNAAPATRDQMRDFVDAIEKDRRPVADIEEGHKSTACCALANLSMDLGRPLTWDSKKHRVVNDDEANAGLARAYRGPWVHPSKS